MQNNKKSLSGFFLFHPLLYHKIFVKFDKSNLACNSFFIRKIILFIENYFSNLFLYFVKNAHWELIGSANNFFSFSFKRSKQNKENKPRFIHTKKIVHYLCKMGIQKTQTNSLNKPSWVVHWLIDRMVTDRFAFACFTLLKRHSFSSVSYTLVLRISLN